MKNLGIAIVALLIIAGSGTFLGWQIVRSRQDAPEGTAPPAGAPPRASVPLPMGAQDAKVFVYVAVPPESVCQEPAREALAGLVHKYPEQLFVYFAPFVVGMPGAEDPYSKIPSLSEFGREPPVVDTLPFCAYVAVNGKVDFTVEGKEGEESEEIVLSGPPGDENVFSVEDLRRVIEQEIIAQYGHLPEPAPETRSPAH